MDDWVTDKREGEVFSHGLRSSVEFAYSPRRPESRPHSGPVWFLTIIGMSDEF